MALMATKTTTGFIVEGTDAVGKDVEIFYDNVEAADYIRLSEFEDQFLKNKEFIEERAKLPDPERDLYLTIFGSGSEPEDSALHTTLVEPRDAQDGLSLDWTRNPVTTVLRLIDQGESDRLRLVADRLVDMGRPVQQGPTSSGYVGRHVAGN